MFGVAKVSKVEQIHSEDSVESQANADSRWVPNE